MPYFQTRARAIDMLGRQQIAGISTAVSELFKNAYDAYANRVEADLFREDDVLVLRDDGIGMTANDFANRWLTIATDSKVENALLPKPAIPTDVEPRPTLGEKGIGRLAIATLGPTTLVLTRARTPEGQDEIVCCLLDWEMFELPGINLSEIEIPLVTRLPDSLPTASDVKKLAELYAPTLARVQGRTDASKLLAITQRLGAIDVDPSLLQGKLGGLSLLERSGTHFFIKPVDERVTSQLDLASTDPTNQSSLVRLLIGFSNTMTPGHPPEPIKTAFRDHRKDRTVDVISEDQFFTPEEFKNADHQIVGTFDEWGTFRGKVWVYGEPEDYELPLAVKGDRRRLACGPFKFSLAVVQASPAETTIPPVPYEALKKKLERYGGLYIYNDDIRVLPYGDSRTDFIDIERRRSQHFGRAFYSYRRMFGVIELTRAQNSNLKEKAGREGFRENGAFVDFRETLKHFFEQSAADFFVPEGKRSARFIERRDKLKHVAEEERRRTAEANRARSELSDRVSSLTRSLDSGEFSAAASEIAAQLDRDATIARAIADPSARRSALYAASSRAHSDANALRLKYQIEAPPGLGLKPRLRRDLDAYQDELVRQVQAFIEPMFFEVEREADEGADEARRLQYLQDGVERVFKNALDSLRASFDGLFVAASEVTPRVRELTEEIESILTSVREKCSAELAATALENLSGREVFDLSNRLERELTNAFEDAQRTVSAFAAQIERLRWQRNNGTIITEIEVSTALEDKLLALEEQASQDLELAQLGLFSQVINHEFVASMQSVRHSIARLGDIVRDRPEFKRVYEDIHAGFGALDGYLRLFTPLQRRLYGPRTTVRGRRLFPNIQRVFEERLHKIGATLEPTNEFLEFESHMYPSTFFPVAVNLIDNALHWLETSPAPRRVVISAIDDAILISNNGPAIAERDHENIFEPGFSRKPDGRGLGLWISRQALERDGYRLFLATPEPGMNVTFAIAPASGESDRDQEAVKE